MTFPIIFFGSDNFSAKILNIFYNDPNIDVVAVIIKSKKINRKKLHPCFELACLNKTPVFEGFSEIDKWPSVKMGFLYSFGALIPQKVLDLFPLGIINLHPSLLPLYRGATPLNAALLKGDQFFGISLLKTVLKLDAGPLVHQTKLSLNMNDNYLSLQEKIVEWSKNNLINILLEYIKNQQTFPQKAQKITFTSKTKNQDLKINWNNTMNAIFNQIRAFAPKPGAYTLYNSQKCLILQASLVNNNLLTELNVHKIKKAGTLVFYKKMLFVRVSDGWLEINQLKLANRSLIGAHDFYNGYLKNNNLLIFNNEI